MGKIKISNEEYQSLIARANVAEKYEILKSMGGLEQVSKDDLWNWSEGLNRILHTNNKQTSLNTLYSYFPENEAERLQEFYRECKDNGRRKGDVFEIRTPDEFTRQLKAHLVYEEEKGLWVFQDITEPYQREQKLRIQRDTDGLTGVLNYTGLQNTLDRFNRLGINSIGVIQVDLDKMKELNDTYGHHHGDYALQKTAEVLSLSVRDVDAVARVGGDEFMILCPNIGEDSLAEIAKRIEHKKRDYNDFSFSIGYAIGEIDSAKEIAKQADKNMYSSKRNGKR